MDFVYSLFKYSSKKDWSDGLLWLGWNFICGLMPIWITILLLKIVQEPIEAKIFTNNGEFALYAASFLGTSLYIVLRDFRRRGYPSRGILSLIMVPLLLIMGLLYSTVALSYVLSEKKAIPVLENIDRIFIADFTLFSLPVIFIITFLIIVGDNIRSSEDIREIQNENYKKLDRDFDELEGN